MASYLLGDNRANTLSSGNLILRQRMATREHVRIIYYAHQQNQQHHYTQDWLDRTIINAVAIEEQSEERTRAEWWGYTFAQGRVHGEK